MIRKPDWRLRFDAFLSQRQSVPFRWGENDCCLFAADCVLAITGVDLAVEFRGMGARRSARFVRAAGGLEALVSRYLGFPIAAQDAAQGDVVQVRTGKRMAIGIRADAAHVVGPGAAGLVWLPLARANRAWKVG